MRVLMHCCIRNIKRCLYIHIHARVHANIMNRNMVDGRENTSTLRITLRNTSWILCELIPLSFFFFYFFCYCRCKHKRRIWHTQQQFSAYVLYTLVRWWRTEKECWTIHCYIIIWFRFVNRRSPSKTILYAIDISRQNTALPCDQYNIFRTEFFLSLCLPIYSKCQGKIICCFSINLTNFIDFILLFFFWGIIEKNLL